MLCLTYIIILEVLIIGFTIFIIMPIIFVSDVGVMHCKFLTKFALDRLEYPLNHDRAPAYKRSPGRSRSAIASCGRCFNLMFHP